MTRPAPELQFVKGDAVLGDARSFCEQVLKRFRTSTRMQTWNITQQAYAISAYCDDVTRTAIEDAIAEDNFDCGVGGNGIAAEPANPAFNRRFTSLPVDAVDGQPQQVGTLAEFSSFFQRVFSRVEAVDEARTQVERTLGQTQDLEHHWHIFCRYLELLPQAVPGTPNRLSGAHLQHWHWSLSGGHLAYPTASWNTTRCASSLWTGMPRGPSPLCRNPMTSASQRTRLWLMLQAGPLTAREAS